MAQAIINQIIVVDGRWWLVLDVDTFRECFKCEEVGRNFKANIYFEEVACE